MRCPSSTEKERTNPRQMEGYALASIIPSFVLLSQLFLLNQSGAMVLSDHLLHSVFMGTVFGSDSFVQCGTHKHRDSLAVWWYCLLVMVHSALVVLSANLVHLWILELFKLMIHLVDVILSTLMVTYEILVLSVALVHFLLMVLLY